MVIQVFHGGCVTTRKLGSRNIRWFVNLRNIFTAINHVVAVFVGGRLQCIWIGTSLNVVVAKCVGRQGRKDLVVVVGVATATGATVRIG